MANPISIMAPVTPSSAAPAGRGGASAGATDTAAADGERQAPAPRGKEAPAAEQSARDLAQATQDISNYIQTVSRSLEIAVDGDLGSTVITVVNADTDEVVRQIPSEEVLQIARFLADQQSGSGTDAAVAGLLFNDQA